MFRGMSFCLIVFQSGSFGRHAHIIEFEINYIVVVPVITKGSKVSQWFVKWICYMP